MSKVAWFLMNGFFLALLQGCGGSSNQNESQQSVAQVPQTIRFIQLNDLHANLVSHAEQVRQNNGEKVLLSPRGGLARTATLIKQLRAQQPETSILLNIGDTFHGGAEAMFTNGNAIVDSVNALGIDVGTPGNWDYAYGPVVTNARFGNLQLQDVKRPNYLNLAANATYKIPTSIQNSPLLSNKVQSTFKYTAGEPFLPASTMIEKKGIQVGVIGLTSDIVEKMHELMAFNISFTQGKENYLQLIQSHAKDLKSQGANMVVVISELGIHKDWQLAKALAAGEVQIFFSAHTHEATFEALKADNGTLVVEAGNDTYLGQMDVDFDENKTITSYKWTLHTVTTSIAEDSEMKSIIETARAPFLVDNPNISIPTVTPLGIPSDILPTMFTQTLDKSIDAVVGTVTLPLSRRNALENEFNNLYADWLKNYTKADVAMTPGFRFDSAVIPHEHDHTGNTADYYWETESNVVLDGKVTVADAYRFFPAPYQLAQGQISGAGMKAVIEENLNAVFSPTVFEQEGGWVDGFSGLKLQLDLSNAKGERVIAMTQTDGTKIGDGDTLVVAGCARPMDQNASTTLCSYEGFANVSTLSHPDKTNETFPAVDLLLKAVSENWNDRFNLTQRHDIKDVHETEMWPDSQFYQPLEGVSK